MGPLPTIFSHHLPPDEEMVPGPEVEGEGTREQLLHCRRLAHRDVMPQAVFVRPGSAGIKPSDRLWTGFAPPMSPVAGAMIQDDEDAVDGGAPTMLLPPACAAGGPRVSAPFRKSRPDHLGADVSVTARRTVWDHGEDEFLLDGASIASSDMRVLEKRRAARRRREVRRAAGGSRKIVVWIFLGVALLATLAVGGYFVYSNFIAEHVQQVDKNQRTEDVHEQDAGRGFLTGGTETEPTSVDSAMTGSEDMNQSPPRKVPAVRMPPRGEAFPAEAFWHFWKDDDDNNPGPGFFMAYSPEQSDVLEKAYQVFRENPDQNEVTLHIAPTDRLPFNVVVAFNNRGRIHNQKSARGRIRRVLRDSPEESARASARSVLPGGGVPPAGAGGPPTTPGRTSSRSFPQETPRSVGPATPRGGVLTPRTKANDESAFHVTIKNVERVGEQLYASDQSDEGGWRGVYMNFFNSVENGTLKVPDEVKPTIVEVLLTGGEEGEDDVVRNANEIFVNHIKKKGSGTAAAARVVRDVVLAVKLSGNNRCDSARSSTLSARSHTELSARSSRGLSMEKSPGRSSRVDQEVELGKLKLVQQDCPTSSSVAPML